MSVTNGQQRVTKTFPVFDCDAHVNDPLDIWEKYVPKNKQELVKRTYWRNDEGAVVNGETICLGGGNAVAMIVERGT